jgi:alpha-mannosidase
MLEGPGVVLSALKPAEDGNGLVARVLNPTDAPAEVALHWNVPVGHAESVRLDEEPADADVAPVQITEGSVVRLSVPPHALRSARIRLQPQ